MGLWDRIRDIGRSRRTESPNQWRERMDVTVREQQSTLAQLRRALADLSTNRRRVELQLTRLRQQAGGLDATAAERVAAGDDDGARQALASKVSLERAVADLEGRHAALVADEQKLGATADRVQTQIDDFRIRADTLLARESAASAQTQMHQATRDQGDIAAELDAVDRRTRELEATAAAYDELADPATDPEAWDRAFEESTAALPHEGEGHGPKSLPQ